MSTKSDGRLAEPPCVAELVTQQAAANPSAMAVCAGRDALSYAELESRSNRLAAHLKTLGVGRDAAVGLYLERSPAMVVAALAILKAGGAYIPLDPVHPVERLAFMLRDSNAGMVVTSAGLTAGFPSGAWRMIALDSDMEKIAAHTDAAPESGVGLDDLAYIIYASGSTGQPKGVELIHSGLTNLVCWHQREFQVTSSDRASAQSALGFDAAVWEMWSYLASGASLHLAGELVRNDAIALRDWIVSRRITISFAATVMAEQLLRLDWPAETLLRFLPSIRGRSPGNRAESRWRRIGAAACAGCRSSPRGHKCYSRVRPAPGPVRRFHPALRWRGGRLRSAYPDRKSGCDEIGEI